MICSKSYGQIQVFQCPCGCFTMEAFSAHFLRSKKPHKTKKRETQTSNRVSRCLSHFGLHSWGKQETSLNNQMIICGMLEISGILLENFYQAVGSPHTPQGKALELGPCTAVRQERGRPSQGPDCMQRRKNTHYCWAAQSKTKKSVPSLYKPLQIPPSLLWKLKLLASKCWHRINYCRTKRNTFQYILQAPGFSFYNCFCHHTCLIDAVFTAKFVFKGWGENIFSLFSANAISNQLHEFHKQTERL